VPEADQPRQTTRSTPLRRFPDGPPDGLLDRSPRELLRELGTTTWLRLPGTGDDPARAVSTLLHGDESTGLEALLHVLRRRRRYPFDLHVVIGNVEAALHGSGFAHRFLDGQEDGNRIWGPRRAGEVSSPQRRDADAILGELLAAPLAGLVDVHNTTGANPFHALVNREDPASLDLATRFSTTVLRWDLGAGTLLEAVAEHAPAAAVECGLPGRRASTAFAVDGLRRALGPPPGATPPADHDLVRDLRRVTVRDEVRFRFGGHPDAEADLALVADGDAANLRPVPAGHVLGHVRPGAPQPLQVTDPDGDDLTRRFLAVTPEGAVVTRTETTPVMVVRTVEAVRKDCLCYLAATR
jgi:succinylglutamate desuccinylase